MEPDEIIDPPPVWTRTAWIAGTTPRDMHAARRAWGAPTHTHHPATTDRMATTDTDHRGPLPFAASVPPTGTTRPECRHRIGWALVLMCLAETIVTATTVASGSYVLGFAAVASMFACGLFLIAAESISAARQTIR